MCGLCGIVRLDGAPVERAELERMVDALGHRGPDGRAVWTDGPVGLGHTRLAIIDVAGGDQPIANEDGSARVVFNGEIYGYRGLTERLVAAGHAFRTRSDTETLVHAYEQWGDELVRELDGFFAFALWDARRRRLLLARDPLGKKPLFVAKRGDRFLFASEPRAILAAWDGRPELDPRVLDDVLAVRYARGRRSGFAGIERLLPGERLALGVDGSAERVRFWTPPPPAPVPMRLDDAADELRARLDRAVAARLESEVPLGLLLSGGLDSTAVLESLSRVAARPPDAFTVAFSREEESEVEAARRVAEHFGAAHHRFDLTEADVLGHVDELLERLDEPLADPSLLPTALVCRLARTRVTVCLTGDGGDEAFGGYPRYRYALEDAARPRLAGARADLARGLLARLPPHRWKAWKLARRLRRALASDEARCVERLLSLEAPLRARLLGPRVPDAVRPDELEAALTDALAGPGDLAARMMAADYAEQLPGMILPKVDRASMMHSLEARSPFLDRELVEWAATVPTELKLDASGGKLVLRRALEGRVPPGHLERRKRGFGTPLGRWFRHELAGWLERTLLDGRLAADGWLDRSALAEVVDAHRTKRRNLGEPLWSLAVLETWYRRRIA